MSDSLRERKRRVALAPDDAVARAELGEALFQAGQLSDATVQLERALALEPDTAGARRVLARVYAADNRPTLAEKMLMDALRRDHKDLRARGDLAELLERSERLDEALLQREVLSRHAPHDLANLKDAVRLAEATGYEQLGLRLARAAQAVSPEDADARSAVARLGLAVGDLDAVVGEAVRPKGAELLLGRLRERLASAPLDAHVSTPELKEVGFAIRARDLARAKRALVLLIHPSGTADYLRGALLSVEGKHLAAKAAFEAALHKSLSSAVRAQVLQGLCELALHDCDRARASEHLARALELDSSDAELAERLGDLRLACDDLAGARAAYELASTSLRAPSAAAKLAMLRASAASTTESEPSGRIAGLAFSGRGGVVTPIEAVVSKGQGKLTTTGNLGKIGAEAAQVAFQCVRARASALGITLDMSQQDVHVHFADLTLLRDGPSAGIAIALALISALRRLPLPKNLAATGELTLHGHVRAVSGLREKLIAAYLSGHSVVIAPRATLFDIRELPQELIDALRVVFVDSLSEAIAAAFA